MNKTEVDYWTADWRAALEDDCDLNHVREFKNIADVYAWLNRPAYELSTCIMCDDLGCSLCNEEY